MHWQPTASLSTLRLRAETLQAIRHFFAINKVLEVDTPTLSLAGVTDVNIESMTLDMQGEALRYLHTSPEFAMKRLLAFGSGDIYQIAKVFRQGEVGRNHNPEFTLLEWYRLGFNHHDLMQELDKLLSSLWIAHHALPKSDYISYADAINKATGQALSSLNPKAIEQLLLERGHCPPDSMGDELDPWLDLLMTHIVGASFARDRFTFLYDYPASQASLAKIRPDNPAVAERFELYFGALELANGFHELQDANEQAARFERDVQQRKAQGCSSVPIDQHLISALQAGLPACSGVALGIDRLLMVLCQADHIENVISFSFHHA
jgi:lysyl-tRNA synthetase class 2